MARGATADYALKASQARGGNACEDCTNADDFDRRESADSLAVHWMEFGFAAPVAAIAQLHI